MDKSKEPKRCWAMSKPREFWISNTENSRGEKYTIGIWAHEKVIETMIKVVPKSAADKLAEALESVIVAFEQTSSLTPTQIYQFTESKKQALAEYMGESE